MEKVICPVCNQKISNKGNLKRHLKIYERREADHLKLIVKTKDFICECHGKAFHSKKGLDKHLKYYKSLKEDICLLCGEKFVSKRSLDRHLETYKNREHPVIKNIKVPDNLICPKCSRKYANKKCLKAHLLKYEGKPHPRVIKIPIDLICPCHNQKFETTEKYKQHIENFKNSDKRKKNYYENKEEKLAAIKAWSDKNREEIRVKQALRRAKPENKLKIKEYFQTIAGIFSHVKALAKPRNLEVGFTLEEFTKWYAEEDAKEKCYYCERLKEECLQDVYYEHVTRLTIDRKDNDLGYIPGNVVLACCPCNFEFKNCRLTEAQIVLLRPMLSTQIRKLNEDRRQSRQQEIQDINEHFCLD